MYQYLNIVQSLFLQAWYLPSVIFLSFVIYYINKSKKISAFESKFDKPNYSLVYFWAVAMFIVLSAPYWLLGDHAPHGTSDDVSNTLQTYLSSSHQGDSFNWTNGLLGGMDRWLLPNCHPLSLGRIYALFLKPYQLYLLVLGINIISIFVFSWKIQTEFWRMRPWVAYIGSAVAVMVEGLWTFHGHVSNGHGFAVIFAGVYFLTRLCDHRPLFIVTAMLTGLAMAYGSWTPFHNLPPLIVTVSLFGLVFWSKDAWVKVVLANTSILAAWSIALLPYFLATVFLFPGSARFGTTQQTVHLSSFYWWPPMIVLASIAILGLIFKIYQQHKIKQVSVMFLLFASIPLAAYVFELLKFMPSFRWELLYAGNEAWLWMAVIFFLDKLQQSIAMKWVIGGIVSRLLMISLWGVLIAYAWMASLWIDLDASYPSGNWHTLTDTSISSVLKTMESQPVRVVAIDDTNDMHFWGQYQGLEPIVGYTPFIDKRKIDFWWRSAMFPGSGSSLYTTQFLSVPIPVQGHDKKINFPVPLTYLINSDALKLSNVAWIVSHHPLYPMQGLQLIQGEPGKVPACTDTPPSLSRVDFNDLQWYWKNIRCIVQDFSYPRPLYLYHLEGVLPRAYLAHHIASWPQGQSPVLNKEQLAQAVKGTAWVDLEHWKEYSKPVDSRVDMEDYHSDYMRLKIKAQGESLVILSSTLNSYWHIIVDGQAVEFFDVNGFQEGFWVSKDSQQAELVYCPPFRLSSHPMCSKLSKI